MKIANSTFWGKSKPNGTGQTGNAEGERGTKLQKESPDSSQKRTQGSRTKKKGGMAGKSKPWGDTRKWFFLFLTRGLKKTKQRFRGEKKKRLGDRVADEEACFDRAKIGKRGGPGVRFYLVGRGKHRRRSSPLGGGGNGWVMAREKEWGGLGVRNRVKEGSEAHH